MQTLVMISCFELLLLQLLRNLCYRHLKLHRQRGVMIVCFFFSSRRRHTRLTCDWSSDVCSSDLPKCHDWPSHSIWKASAAKTKPRKTRTSPRVQPASVLVCAKRISNTARCVAYQIGRASCRERG